MYFELKEKYKKESSQCANYDHLLTALSSMFDWEVPDIDTVFIDVYLLMFGECAVWRYNGKLIVSSCGRAGKPNPNGLGSDLICVTGDGTSKTFRDFENSDEVVYIRNNKTATPDPKFEITASRLTELGVSLEHNIINARYTPFVMCRDANAYKAIKKAFEENNSGGVQVVLSDNIFSEEHEEVLNITDVNAQDKIQYINHAVDDLMRQFWSTYGLDVCGGSKQAQQTTDEINAGCNARLVLPLDMLRERRKGAEAISSKFGVECSVDFSEAWRREQKQAEQTEEAEAFDVERDESPEGEEESNNENL